MNIQRNIRKMLTFPEFRKSNKNYRKFENSRIKNFLNELIMRFYFNFHTIEESSTHYHIDIGIASFSH